MPPIDTSERAPLTRAEGLFNAFTDPWIPVERADGTPDVLSIAEVLIGASGIRRLGSGLAPLERDAVLRLLISLTGLCVRYGGFDPEDERPDAIPFSGVEAVRDTFVDYFWLRHPTKPFCQEWDLRQDDANKAIRDLAYLDPQTPGSSSSQWGVIGGDAEIKSAALRCDYARLVVLTLVTRWHTKHGNARDGAGRKFEYGAPGDVAVRTMGVYTHHDLSLARTLLSNVPTQWLDSASLPAYLSPDEGPGTPTDATLAAEPLDLWRSTYARNTPLLHWAETDGVVSASGFVLGPSTRRVPLLAETAGESLKTMHALDSSRLFVTTAKKNGSVETKAVSALDVRLSSTEGFLRWYQNHLSSALADWRGRVSPLIAPPDSGPDANSWSMAVLAEICDTQGNRKWLDYVVVPRRRLLARTQMADGTPGPIVLFDVAANMRSSLNGPLRMAAEGRTRADGNPALRAQTERALLAAFEETLVLALDDGADANAAFDARAAADAMLRIARDVFDTATEPFATPGAIASVAAARNMYRTKIRRGVEDIFDPEAAAERKKKKTKKK